MNKKIYNYLYIIRRKNLHKINKYLEEGGEKKYI